MQDMVLKVECPNDGSECSVVGGKIMESMVLLGDGEQNEGQVWEAAMFSSHHNLSSLCAIIDVNKIQIDGSKGVSLNYRSASNQLRQTILLTSSNNWVTARAPLNEFHNSENNLDTLGIIFNQNKCKKRSK